jgi:hypothetical protein
MAFEFFHKGVGVHDLDILEVPYLKEMIIA